MDKSKKSRKVIVPVLKIPLLMLFSIYSHSSTNHSHQEIEAQAIEHINQILNEGQMIPSNSQLVTSIQPIDPRLGLSQCDDPLLFSDPNISQRTLQRISIKVSCRKPQSWSIYLRAKTEVLNEVILANTAIPRGTVITRQHLQAKRLNISSLYRGYYTDPKRLIGSITRTNINSNQVISPNQVKPRMTIRTGESVTILSNTHGFSVAANGIALDSGQVGDQIKVRNIRSNRVIAARIEKEGIVTVRR